MSAVALSIAVVVAAFFASRPPSAVGSVIGTVHNLGYFTVGTVRSPDTTEICVFCHTPHSSNPVGPLWNRSEQGTTYTVYASGTMTAVLGQPNGSSKLCLSCHDGTVAMGSVLNMPGAYTAGTLALLNTTSGKLLSSATTNLKTDLRDDHPISFNYDYVDTSHEYKTEDANNRLSPYTYPSDVLAVELDSNNLVQCTSCHDPHDNSKGDFLVESLDNAALCTYCHDKLHWDASGSDTIGGVGSIHYTSTATWNSTDPNPWQRDLGAAGYTNDTPALHGCLSCHRAHNGAAEMQLTAGVNPLLSSEVGEEWTCISCHNGNVASKDVEAEVDKTYDHKVKSATFYGRHSPYRSRSDLPISERDVDLRLANRHAECADCHNPHAAQSGNHTVGGIVLGGASGNRIGKNLLGAWGVYPATWPSRGVGLDNTVTSYTETHFTEPVETMSPQQLEGYLCLKCHSAFAYGTILSASYRPEVPSGAGPTVTDTVLEEDITKSMSINNIGIHPVFAEGKNQPPANANPNWNYPTNQDGLSNTFVYQDWPGPGTRTGFYRIMHTSTITCSDCHGSDSSTAPKGPHGSDNLWILKSDEINSGTNMCLNCHRRKVYGDQNITLSGGDDKTNFSRVQHPVDGNSFTVSETYKSGAGYGHDANTLGNLCLTCHGGAWNDLGGATGVIEGIHGSNADMGAASTDPLGYRMMNGACVKSYTRPTTTTSGSIDFYSAGELGTHKTCKTALTDITISTTRVQYNCTDVTDCN